MICNKENLERDGQDTITIIDVPEDKPKSRKYKLKFVIIRLSTVNNMYMALSSTRQHFSLRFSFFYAESDGSQFSWELNFFKIPKAYFNSYNVYLRKFKFQHLGVI